MRILAAFLVLAAIANVYFVWHGFRLYLATEPRSGILRALLVVKVVVWATGLFVALVAGRVLLELSPLPFAGFGLGLVLLAISLLPAYIHLEMLRIVRDDDG